MYLLRPNADDGAVVSKADTVRAPNVAVAKERPEHDLPDSLAQGRFTVIKKLGEGSFGMVYAGTDTKRQMQVAIKVEHKRSSASGQLANESRLMDLLSRPEPRPGFAELYHFSKEASYAILVMDLLGLSLEQSLQDCGGVLNATSCGLAAEQAIHHLSYLHSKGIVHRDIKSENFMWGTGAKLHHLYIIDFGMSSRYWLKKHVRFGSGKHLTGTARYASVHAMKGCTQSRRDDLEAVGYLLIYMLRGHLPWSGLNAPTWNDKLRLICDKKERMKMEELCHGYPKQFEAFLLYCRNLAFEQMPDYDQLMADFKSLRTEDTQDWHLQWLMGTNIDPQKLVPLQTDRKCPAQPEVVGAEGGFVETQSSYSQQTSSSPRVSTQRSHRSRRKADA